jgi:hypothetical protein
MPNPNFVGKPATQKNVPGYVKIHSILVRIYRISRGAGPLIAHREK